MEKIKGIKTLNLGFKLEKLGDFLNEEGPILSHFVNDRNEDFLFFWVDEDEKYHRWMNFKTTNDQLHQFFQGNQTIKDLIQNTPDGIIYFIDIDAKLDYRNITLTSVEQIPKNYLPSDNSYFTPEQFEEYALNLKNYLQLHFNRLRKLNPIDNFISSVAEPNVPYFTKKKESKQ